MKTELLHFGHVKEEESLKKYNTFRIGGICKYIIEPETVEKLVKLVKYLNSKEEKYFVLGNGSNVIISDEYYDGVVIRLNHFDRLDITVNEVKVGAGVMLPRLAISTMNEGYTGFEWACGIPGTVGGAIYGNAEAYKESIFDHLVDVTVITPNCEVKTFLKSELSHSYRTSFFKETKGYLILEATFSLQKGDMEESRMKIEKRKAKRMETQPLEYPSAGSVFRNPSPENPSGKIIEELGLKGLSVGGAQVSHKHANFIINISGATSKDVRNLIELVHKEVKEQCDIDLIMEQEYVGWD